MGLSFPFMSLTFFLFLFFSFWHGLSLRFYRDSFAKKKKQREGEGRKQKERERGPQKPTDYSLIHIYYLCGSLGNCLYGKVASRKQLCILFVPREVSIPCHWFLFIFLCSDFLFLNSYAFLLPFSFCF